MGCVFFEMPSLKDRIPEKKKVDELKKILEEKFHIGFSKQPEAESSEIVDEKKVEALKNLIQQKTLEAKEGQVEKQLPKGEGLFGFFQKKPQTQPSPSMQTPVTQTPPMQPKPVGPPKAKGQGFSAAGFFKSLEDKWYNFLDKVDEHLPVYNVIDKIDEFVPSFYVFLGLLLAILLLLLFFLAVPIVSSFLTPEYSFLVVDESDNPVSAALVSIVSAGQDFEEMSGDDGSFSLKLPESFVQMTVSKDGFETFSSELDLLKGEQNKIVLKRKQLSFIKKNVEVYLDGELFDGSVKLTFACSNSIASPPARLTINDGLARDIAFAENCGAMSVTVEAQGFETQTLSFGSDPTLVVYLQSSESIGGSIKVTLVDSDSGEAVGTASVSLYDDKGVSKDSVLSSASGIAMFEGIVPGNYYVQVSQARGYEEKTSPVFSVQPREQTSFTLQLDSIPENEIKKIFLKFVDSKTSKPVQGVQTWLVVNDNVLPPSFASDENGFVAMRNLSGKGEFGFIANHADYVLFVEDDAVLVEDGSTSFTTVRLVPSDASNSMNAVVDVFDGQQRVQNAYVALYNKDYNFSIAWANTGAEGKARFEDLPPGTYHAFAQVEGEKEGESQPKTGKAGETVNLRVQLSNILGGIRVVVTDSLGQYVTDANVMVFSYPDNGLLDQNKTNSSGVAGDFNYTVDLAIYAIVSKPGYISAQSETKPVIQDIVQTIPVQLVAEQGFDKGSPKIEFVRIENLNSEPLSGYLLDNADYYLKFRLFVPENNKDGNAAVFFENDLLRFRLTEIGSDFVASYFDCENRQNPYDNPSCLAGNPSDATKHLRLGFGTLPSRFYTFRIKSNIADIGDIVQQASAFFGVKSVKISGESKTDPASGLHEKVLTINEPIPCEGTPDECPVFAWAIDVARHSDGFKPDYSDSVLELEVDQAYDMNVKVANITDVNDFRNLSFKISDPSDSGTLGVGTLDSDPFVYTSSPFNLPPRSEYKVDNLALDPREINLVNEAFELLNVPGGEVPPFEVVFDILEPNALMVSADPDTVEENTIPTVTVTITDSRNGSLVGGAEVIIISTLPGQGEPTEFPCVNEEHKACYTDDGQDGLVTFSLPQMAVGSNHWIVAKKTGYGDTNPPLQVIVRSGSANFGGNVLDCVKVCLGNDTGCTENNTEVGVVLNGNDTQKQNVFTVKSTCDEEVVVSFAKEIAPELDQSSVQIKSGGQTDGDFRIGSQGSKTFSIDTKSECPALDPANSGPGLQEKLCPGEYRVYISAQTTAGLENGQLPSKLSTVRIFKMPQSANQFGICKGENGTNCDISAGAAAFYIGLLSGEDRDGIEEFVAKNYTVPSPPKNDLSFMDTKLSTCEGGIGAVCTDLQVARNFATVGFEYRMSVTIDGRTTIGPWHAGALKIFESSLQETGWALDSSDEAARAYNEGYSGEESLEITFDVNPQSIVENLPPGMQIEITKEMIEQGLQRPSDNSYGYKIMGRLVAENQSSTKTDNPGAVLNNSLLSDTGALLTLSDHVPRSGIGSGYLPVTFSLNYKATSDDGGECRLSKEGFSIVADGEKHPLAVSSVNSLKSQDESFKNCVDDLTDPSFEVSIVDGSLEFQQDLCRDDPCQPSVCFSFSEEDNECSGAIVSSDSSLQIFAQTGVPTQSTGKNYQLIYLFDTSGSVNDKWGEVCDLISNDPQKSSVAAALAEKGIGVASTHVFAMGLGERSDVECADQITYLPWWDELVQDYTKIGKTILDSDYSISCDVDGQSRGYCENIRADSEPEAWAPFLHTIIKIFSGQLTEENRPEGVEDELWSRVFEAGSFSDETVPKLFIIGSDSDPTGIFGLAGYCYWWGYCPRQPANSIHFWRHSNEWFDGDNGNNRNKDELISEEAIVQKLEELTASIDKTKFGSLNFYFTHGSWEGGFDEGFNNQWDGGCAENREECNDLYEAMNHFKTFIIDNGVGQAFIENLELEEFSSDIVDIILNIENTQLREERFHVILEAGEDSVCYSGDGRKGLSGQNAVSSIRRSFDWTWNAGFGGNFSSREVRSFCNPELVDNGGQNEDFVFCDSSQFTNMVLNRVLVLASGQKDIFDWKTSEAVFTSALIKDGYNSSFLGDFAAWADQFEGSLGRGIPTDLFGSNFDLKKYVDTGRIEFEIRDQSGELVDTIILPESGYYDVEIKVLFDRGFDGVFMDDDSPTATIKVVLQLEKKLSPSENLFYFLPFDGEIGLGGQRTNYGVGYEIADEDEQVLLFNTSDITIKTISTGGGLATISINKIDATDGAFGLLNAQVVSQPNTTSRGTVLTIVKETESNYNLEFIPGYASPVFIKVRKAANSLNADAAFYVEDASENKIPTNGVPLYNWMGIASDVDQTCNGFDHHLIGRGITTEVDKQVSCGGGENSYGFEMPVADDLLAEEKVNVFGSLVYTLENLSSVSAQDDCGEVATVGSSSFTAKVPIIGVPDVTELSLSTVLKHVEETSFGSLTQGDYCLYSGDIGGQNGIQVWFNESDIIKSAVADSSIGLYSGLNTCFG